MSDLRSINIFLDERLVDELWILAKREGLLVERVREATAKVAGKAKFGLGKLWQWLAADVEAEISGEAGGKTSQKLEITSVFRALILPELIGDIARIGAGGGTSITDLEPGAFVEILTPTLELFPLPTFAGFLRQMAISSVGEAEDQSNATFDSEKAMSFAEKFTSAQRALTFVLRLDGDSASSALQALYNSEADEIFNALCMSNDDHVLALSAFPGNTGVLIFSVLEERHLKRNLAVFAIGRPIRVFGRVASVTRGKLLGIQPISIALS